MLILKTKDLAEVDPENKGFSKVDPENKGFNSLASLWGRETADVSLRSNMTSEFGGCAWFLGILFYFFSLTSWGNSDAFGSGWNCGT
jgi:hypothetical protein